MNNDRNAPRGGNGVGFWNTMPILALSRVTS
jgi:hypothetical protein